MTQGMTNMRDAPPAERLLIDGAMPTFDVSIDEHLIVRRDPATTYDAARHLDFLRVHTRCSMQRC
jgi:hypothetical protein